MQLIAPFGSVIVAGTGHRPDKLGGSGDQVREWLIDLAIAYIEHVEPHLLISGMALGWDQAIAEGAIRTGVPFIAAVPFDGFHSKWPEASQLRYHMLLAKARDVHVVCEPGYASWKMQRRNEWMVDHTKRMAALWDGSDGGTANCLKYAHARNVPVDSLWETWQVRDWLSLKSALGDA